MGRAGGTDDDEAEGKLQVARDAAETLIELLLHLRLTKKQISSIFSLDCAPRVLRHHKERKINQTK